MKTGSIVLHALVAASLVLAGQGCFAQGSQGSATSSAAIAVSGGAAEKPAVRPQVVKHRLLSRTDIQSDLKLTPSQLQRIEALTQQILDGRETLTPEAASAAEDDIGRLKMALLSEEQRLRLDQIIFWIGGTPMNSEEVRERLSLTADQQAKLKSLDAETEAMRKREGIDAFLKARPELEKRMEGVLTAQQRQQFERLVGRPFVDAGGGGICFQMPPGMAGDGAAPPKLPQLENGKPVPDFVALNRDGNLVGKTVGSNRSAMASSGNAPGWDGTLGEIDPRLAALLNDAGVRLAAAGH